MPHNHFSVDDVLQAIFPAKPPAQLLGELASQFSTDPGAYDRWAGFGVTVPVPAETSAALQKYNGNAPVGRPEWQAAMALAIAAKLSSFSDDDGNGAPSLNPLYISMGGAEGTNRTLMAKFLAADPDWTDPDLNDLMHRFHEEPRILLDIEATRKAVLQTLHIIDPDFKREDVFDANGKLTDPRLRELVYYVGNIIDTAVAANAAASGCNSILDWRAAGSSAKLQFDAFRNLAERVGKKLDVALVATTCDFNMAINNYVGEAEITGFHMKPDYMIDRHPIFSKGFDDAAKAADYVFLVDTNNNGNKLIYKKTPAGETILEPELFQAFQDRAKLRIGAANLAEFKADLPQRAVILPPPNLPAP